MIDNRANRGSKELDWTNWLPMGTGADHNCPAAYEVRIVTGEGVPVAIPRFLSVDRGGLITIGETNRMENRRQQFVCGMAKCYGHSEGNLFHLLIKHSRFNQCFPTYQLEFHYYPVADKAQAQHLQEQLIKQYVRKFGEVPPLNSAIPNRYGNW